MVLPVHAMTRRRGVAAALLLAAGWTAPAWAMPAAPAAAVAPAAAIVHVHDVPASRSILPPDPAWEPGDRYRPYYPEDSPYAVHYRPYLPARPKPVRVVRPHRSSAHVHYSRAAKHPPKPPYAYVKLRPRPLPAAEVASNEVMLHRHVKTKILRPRVVCGFDYNYWGPERLCQYRQ
jgi:hypothetical protein